MSVLQWKSFVEDEDVRPEKPRRYGVTEMRGPNYTIMNQNVVQNNLQHGNLLQIAIGDGGLDVIDGNIKKADIHFVGKANRVRAFADTSSKILFQYMARRSPLRIDDLVASATLPHANDHSLEDNEMVSS